jgi:tetratricopeptide (TPR) repeat protein
MVDPKKDYELLMRYLQRGAAKREPAEQSYAQEWKPEPQPASVVTEPALHPIEHAAHSRRSVFLRKPTFTWPNWKLNWPNWKPLTFHRAARIAIAVLSGVLLLALLWNIIYFFRLSPDSIFDKLYVPFTLTTTNAASPAAKQSIPEFYASGNYVAVALQSKKQKQLSYQEQLLTGLAYMHRSEYTKAIKWLEPLSKNFKSPYRQQAEYYLALTYLKNEDYDRSIEKLEHIFYTPSHPYQAYISENIISDIKMLKWK